MKIEDLCQQIVRAMIHAGYTECCAWSRYRDFYSPMAGALNKLRPQKHE